MLEDVGVGAMRMRLAVSTTRAATLMRRMRMAANSAFLSAAVAGTACRSFHISQYAAVWRMRRIWLALADRHEVRSLFNWVL